MKADAPNQIAALPPWLAGYEMGNDDVALLTFTDNGDALQISTSAILPIDQTGEDFEDIAQAMAQRLSTTNADPNQVVFVVGHGPNGDLHADRVINSIRPVLPTTARLVGLHNDGEAVSSRIGERPWLPAGPPADVSADMVSMGIPAPAASRAMSDRMWHPDPVPGYPGLPADERAALNAAPPSKRAAVAVELLTDLSRGEVLDPATTRSRIAGLFSSNTQHWVQDHVMMTAATADTPALADELRQLYVQAPPEDQQSIAGTAALTAFAQHGNSQPLRAIHDQIDENGPSANDLPMINALAAGGTQPDNFKSMLRTVHQRLHEAGVPTERDAAWQQARPSSQSPQATEDTSPRPPTTPGPEDLPPGSAFSGPSMT